MKKRMEIKINILLFKTFLIVYILSNCNNQPIYLQYQKTLEKHKILFENVAEDFSSQKNYSIIIRINDYTYNIDGMIIKFDNFRNTKINNITNTSIKFKNKKLKFKNWYFSRYEDSFDDFINYLKFLINYDIKSINKSEDIVYIALKSGFLGETSGLLYVTAKNNDNLNQLVQSKQDYLVTLKHLNGRWFYYED